MSGSTRGGPPEPAPSSARPVSRRGIAALAFAVLCLGLVLGAGGTLLSSTWDGAGRQRPAGSAADDRTQRGPLERSGQTRYGASFQLRRGESYAHGLARTDSSLGRLDLVRVFYPGEPAPWPGRAAGRDVVVSFKLDPRSVLAGDYDAQMRKWFASAPRNLDVFWVFWHEPEDDIEDGSFTAADFRAAFARLDRLADQADNPRLVSTVVLMSWSTRQDSGRDWRDYVPPADSVDVFAWDVYNRQGNLGVYSSPAELLDAPRKAAESVGKPFAVAELGSVLVDGDDGAERAEWLRAVGDYLGQHGAVFAAYFNFVWNGGEDDYRLRDAPSLEAWRELGAGS